MNPADVLAALRAAGCTVRRGTDKKGEPAILISPAGRLDDDDRAAVKAHRLGLLALLALEEADAQPCPPCPFRDDEAGLTVAELRAAVSAWAAHNASVAARPEDAAARRAARKGKGTEADEEDLFG